MILMKNTIKIMVATLVLALTASMTTATAADAAKKKTYKTKTVTVTSGKSKTVKTSKKIKKVSISSTNKNFTVKKTGNKSFKVSGTDKGKKQTVKVTYKNKYTQKFKINTVKAKKTKKTPKSIPSYAQKIVNELKPLLADPNRGLQIVLNQWEKKLGYECEFRLMNTSVNGTTTYITLDGIMKNYTVSQKQALILNVYFTNKMTYSKADKGAYYQHRNSNTQFKKLWNGTFKGVCEDGAAMTYDICNYLGLKANYTGSNDLNHAWTCIWVTDKNGISYWHGIEAISYAYNLKASVPVKNNLTKKQVETNYYNPYRTFFKVTNKPAVNPKPVTTTTAPSVTTTQAPVQTPAPQVSQATPTPKPTPTQTTTTVIFNTPEPKPTTEPTKAPVVTQKPTTTETPAPTQTPIATAKPTVEPTQAPTETSTPQCIMIPHEEHNYTCAGCNPLNPPPVRHTNRKNPYITNIRATYKDYVVYQHVIGTEVRRFDADGNEYIDINNDGSIINELIQLAG